MDARELTESITDAVSPALAGTGAVIDDVVVQQAGRRRLVRIFLARDLAPLAADDETSEVEPLSLDEIADASRALSAALDDSDALGEAPYTLEVSSPGVDRPLSTPDRFRRNVGRLVSVATADGGAAAGRLAAVNGHGIRLAGPERTLAWADVTRGTVQVEFSRPERKDD